MKKKAAKPAKSEPTNPRATQAGFRKGAPWGEGWLSVFDGRQARAAGLFPGTGNRALLVRDPGEDVAQFPNCAAASKALQAITVPMRGRAVTFEAFLPAGPSQARREEKTVADIAAFDAEKTAAMIEGINWADGIAAINRGLKAQKWIRTGLEAGEWVDDIALQVETFVKALEQVRGKAPVKQLIEMKQTVDVSELMNLLKAKPEFLAAFKQAIVLIESNPETQLPA